MRIAIVIPAYNEARTIRGLVDRALTQSGDVIVVDDGSTDGTLAALADCKAIVIRHARNQGKGAALWDGFMRAMGLEVDAVVTMDGDGQHRPEDVAALMSAATAHPHALIIAARLRGRERMPRHRSIANRIADLGIGWAAGQAIVDSQSGQRLYPAGLIRQLSSLPLDRTRFAFETDVLIRAAWLGFPCIAIPIDAIYERDARRSHFRPVRDVSSIAMVIARHLVASRFHITTST